MSDKKLDDLFKESFSDYSPEVPPHIWENIAERKKKKRGAFFWLNEKKALLALAVLFLAGAGIYLAANKNNNTNNIALENNGSRQGTEKTVPAAVLDNNRDIEKAAGSSSTSTVATDNDKNAEKADKIEVQGENNDDNKVSLNNSIPGNLPNAPAYNSNDKAAAGTAAITLLKQRKNKLHRYKKATQKITSADPFDRDIAVDHNYTATPGNDDDLAKTDEFNIADVEGSRDMIMLSRENILPKQTIQAGAIRLKEDCPGNTSGNNYYIEAYISPDYAIKKYSDTGNSVLVAKRKESLSIQSAYSAGLRYTRVFANGMSVRTGFNFSQVNEKFSYAQDNIVQIVYIINTAGDTTDSYYVRGTRYKNSYNRYRTIDVPLVVGYEMGNGRFHANINAGVMVNLYSWQKGETLDNNGAPVSITTGKDDNPYQYKTNVGVGFTGAASLYYKLNERFHMLAEPYFRYNFSPMNKEAVSIQERFTTIGLRLGIRMDIK